jgi:flavodoxin
MNGLIACDSYFGNTLQVAEALAEELRAAGHDVEVVNLHSQKLDGPLDADPAKNEGSKWLYPGGGGKLKDALTEQGVDVYPEVLRCLVAEMKGPLVTGALESAREFARRFAAALG